MDKALSIFSGQEVSLMSFYDPQNEILKLEDCEKKDTKDLISIFQQSVKEFGLAYEESKNMLATNQKEKQSKLYSQCVVKCEKTLTSLNNIHKVLFQRNEQKEELKNELSVLQMLMDEMHKNQPTGETQLTMVDLDLMKQIATKPVNDTYESKQLGIFYQPKVSHVDFRTVLNVYQKEGKYVSMITGEKQQFFYGIDMKQMFHSIGFKKTSWQAMYELILHNGTEENKEQLKRRYPPGSDYTIKKKEIETIIHQQNQILQRLEVELPKMNNQYNWEFDKFEILNTEKQIKMNIPLETAVMADIIICYHKSV